MDHRPYEEWLLNDEHLSLEQDRDLRIHLRNCPECAAQARANLALRSAAVIAPAVGFTLRFQARLEAQRKLQLRRSFFGLFLLSVVGLGGIVWLLLPYIPFLTLSPERLASLWISNLIYFALTARVLGAVGNTFLNVLGSLVPAYVWPLAFVMLAGLGFLWTFSFRKVGQIVQSVV